MLKQLITDAAVEGYKQHKIAEHTKQANLARQNAEMNAKADAAIAAIPQLVREAAEKGRLDTCVYKTDYSDIKQYYGNDLTPDKLQGVGAIVYDALVKEGINVQLKYNHDGVGRDSWFEFIVNLKKIIHPVR